MLSVPVLLAACSGVVFSSPPSKKDIPLANKVVGDAKEAMLETLSRIDVSLDSACVTVLSRVDESDCNRVVAPFDILSTGDKVCDVLWTEDTRLSLFSLTLDIACSGVVFSSPPNKDEKPLANKVVGDTKEAILEIVPRMDVSFDSAVLPTLLITVSSLVVNRLEAPSCNIFPGETVLIIFDTLDIILELSDFVLAKACSGVVFSSPPKREEKPLDNKPIGETAAAILETVSKIDVSLDSAFVEEVSKEEESCPAIPSTPFDNCSIGCTFPTVLSIPPVSPVIGLGVVILDSTLLTSDSCFFCSESNKLLTLFVMEALNSRLSINEGAKPMDSASLSQSKRLL